MSDSVALAFLIALLVAGHLSIYWSLMKVFELGDNVATGFVKGAPISIERRSMILVHSYLTTSLFLAGYAALLGIGAWLFARRIGDEYIRVFGYALAVQASFAALMIFGQSIIEALYLRSKLRQAEADLPLRP